MALSVEKRAIEEIKAVIASGDVSLEERRQKFRQMTGCELDLADDLLIAAIAATDDDDDELFVENAKSVKANGVILLPVAAD